ncbi:NfrA family protein [Chitinolyticbacter meiyuanensis]|uniref:NfrA family protein n=1 Tax=Chitinolyticbacter meiyuanensis TaxID=682798 RepID=UPI0011E5EF19|nr:tetratricopeptide repeat protein [Chitinolyticbacter meiyuanensis]
MMPRHLATLLLIAFAAPAFTANERPADLGAEVSSYRRFIVYPRLEKAFAAQAQGDLARAIQEFEAARRLAPNSPTILLYLADAYRHNGEPSRAEPLLHEALRLAPNDAKARDALLALRADLAPAPVPASGIATVTTPTPAPASPLESAPAATGPSPALQSALAAVQRGDFAAADAVLADTAFATSSEGVTLRRAYAQRAIYLQRWAAAEAQLNALQAAGRLTARERSQWLNVLLKQGRIAAASQVIKASSAARDQLAYADALARRGDTAALARYLAATRPAFQTAADEAQWMGLLGQAVDVQYASYTPHFAQNRRSQAEALVPRLVQQGRIDAAWRLLSPLPLDVLVPERFTIALQRGELDTAGRLAERWMSRAGADLALLDRLSYQLLQAGGSDQAARLLLDAYPFGSGRDERRIVLADRLAALIAERPERMNEADRRTLAQPLEGAGERARQAVLFASLGRCDTVRSLLGDLSPEYREQDWMRLGDCYREEMPGLAQYAYAQAAALDDSGYAARTLAYQAFANGDYAAAQAAWQSLPANDLMPGELLSAATTALAAEDQTNARRWLDRYQDLGATRNDEYWWLRAQSSAVPAERRAALQAALEQHPDVRYYMALAALQREAGEHRGALQSLEAAQALDPDNAQLLAALGYAYWQAGDAARARDSLENARWADPDNPALVEQLVYIEQRLADNESARLYARLAVDTLQTHQDDWTDAERDKEYALRRLHEDLGRRWTLNYGGFVGSNSGAVGRGGEPGTAYRSYGQLEFDYRLGDPPIRDGRTLSAYARVFAGSSDGDGGLAALPVHDAMLGAGLRWKPLRDHILYLSAEAQTPLGGTGDTDLMLRASASLLNDGRFADEWHPSGSGWLAQNLYLDAAYYLKQQRFAATADYRLGYHRKLGDGQTLEPYAHLQYNLVQDDGDSTDLRAGIGVRWHVWYGATRYDAWRHKFTVGVEFQHALDTYLADDNTLMLTFGGLW